MADQPVWNPSDKDGDVSLSNGNRTWQQASGTVGCVRSTVGLSSGKWRVQLMQIAANGSACRHGFATAGHALAAAPGNTAASWAINGQGALEHDGATGSDYANFANAAVVQLFVDIDAGRIWYGDAGGPFAGNPAAGTGAMHSFTAGTTLYLAGGMDGGGSTRGGTLRLLADYTGTPPSGFADGWGGGAVGVVAAAGTAGVAATGRAAALHVGTGRILAADAGTLLWSGRPAAGLAGGVTEAAGVGRLLGAGAAAGLVAGHMLAAAAAPVRAAGPAAGVRAGVGRVLAATGGSCAATGAAVRARLGTGTTAADGAIAGIGRPASLRSGAGPAAAAGAVLIAGRAVRLGPATGHAGPAGTGGIATRGGGATVVAGAPVRRPRPAPGDLAALLADPTGDLDWVAVVEPWDAGAGATRPLRWSTRDFTTGAGGSLPHTRIPGRLVDVELRAALWADNAPFGRSQPATGTVVIENADGALDGLGTETTTGGGRRWHFRRRAARILVGHPAWAWDDYRPVFTGEIEQESFADGHLTLALRDRLRRLDQPLQGAVFGGDRVLLASASPVTVGVGPRTFVLPDLVTNGQFTTSLTGWSAGLGWSHGAAHAAKTPGVAAALEQAIATVPDAAYRIRFDVTSTAGTLRCLVDGQTVGDPIAASGTYRPDFVATAIATRIAFLADAAFAGTVDAVSVRPEPAAAPGDAVRIARTSDLAGTWLAGQVASWTESSGTLVVEVAEAVGEGSHSDWSLWLRPGAGGAELAGKNLPAAFGTVRHAAPAALGSVQGLWFYRAADTAIRMAASAGHGVFDGGLVLAPAEGFPPGPGEAFADAAEGLLWLASRPQYPLTATFEAGLGTTAAGRVFARPGHHLFRVPAGVAALRAKLWGAGGGHGGAGAEGSPGGGGGFVDALLAVTAGELLAVAVPAGGGAGLGGVAGGAAGAAGAAVPGGPGGVGATRAGGGGGGAAAILRAGVPVVLAPGGGGGSGEAAGGAGAASGLDGGDGGARHGNGGTVAAGGAGGSGQGAGAGGGAGTAGQGGAGGAGSTSGGGGGGGGLHGGGGGGAGPTGGAGGGGAALAGGGIVIAGSGTAPGGADDPDHAGGAGVGGSGGAAGGPGRVVIDWTPGDIATVTAAPLLAALLRDRAGFRHVRAGAELLVSLAADAAARTLVAGGGSFPALGLRPGDQISLEGEGPNCGINLTVATVAETVLGIVEPIADMAPATDLVLVAGDLDGPALVRLAEDCAQPLGLWLGEESPTGRDLVDRVLAGIGGWVDVTPAGLVTFGRYAGPATIADHALDGRHLLAPPRRVAAGPALWRRRIGARRCWRVHGPGEVAAAAGEPARGFLAQEWREGVAEAPDARIADLGAEEAFAESPLDRREDAAAEAARQLALMSPDRLAFEVDATLAALPWRLGATVALSAPAAGLPAARRLTVVARSVRLADDRITLTLLG